MINDLITFIKKLEFEKIPDNIIGKAKMCILDWIGVSLAATSTPLSKKILQFVLSLKTNLECSLIGSGLKADFINAAFYNATLGHMLELDDTHIRGIIHPGTVIIPSVFSIGERENADCVDIITSIIIGYEVMGKVATSMQPSLRDRGFHATSICGPIGVAAAIAKLLNFDVENIRNALSIAATQSSGLLASFTGDTELKPIHAGFAARNGIFAVQLTCNRIIAPDVFSGYKNFFETFTGSSTTYTILYNNNKKYSNNKKFEILNVGFKIHSACRHFHSAIDALINIMKKNDLRFDDITYIKVRCHGMAIRGHNILSPTTLTGVKMSLPFCLAIAAYKGRVDENVDDILNNKTTYAILRKFAENVELIHDNRFDKLFPEKIPAEVEVYAAGKKFKEYVEYPKGEPQNPLGWEDLITKFTRLNQKRLDEERINEIVRFVKSFEKNKSVKPLMRRLCLHSG